MRIKPLRSATSLLVVVGLAFSAAIAAEPVSPREPVVLFDGHSLRGWYSWLVDTRRDDPRQVFSVREGYLSISGDGLGYLSTKRSFRDYHLVVEFRWGQRTRRDRQAKARDAGLFLHSTGPDGNSVDGDGAWKAGIECQIMQGAVGDLMLIKGHDHQGHVIPLRLTARVGDARDNEGWPYYNTGGREFTLKDWGRINWQDKARDWHDVLDFRGPRDPVRSGDAWNRLECICRGNRLEVRLNGQLVNSAFDVVPSAGQILLQCEGSEILFRRLELLPVTARPKTAD